MPDVKIYGPYPHREGFRCYLRVAKGPRVWAPTGRTPEKAVRLAQGELSDFQEAADFTVDDLCGAYLEHLRINERKPATLSSVQNAHRMLLGPLLTETPNSVTPKLAKARYLELAGSGAAASTHRKALQEARTLWKWGLEEGRAKLNPWRDVRPIGKVKRGKPQLTLDEAARLRDHCLAHALTDDAALAVLIAQEMALRASEIVSRTVRDVDAGGTMLRVGDISDAGKTETSKRPVRIPKDLQPAFRVRIERRKATDALLPSIAHCTARRQWLGKELKRLCRLVGIPEVCPHALRGQWASIAYEAGALPDLVSAVLGHASTATTEQHYATEDAQRAGQQKRKQRWLKAVD